MKIRIIKKNWKLQKWTTNSQPKSLYFTRYDQSKCSSNFLNAWAFTIRYINGRQQFWLDRTSFKDSQALKNASAWPSFDLVSSDRTVCRHLIYVMYLFRKHMRWLHKRITLTNRTFEEQSNCRMLCRISWATNTKSFKCPEADWIWSTDSLHIKQSW